MDKRFLILVIFAISVIDIFPQSERIRGMGNMHYIVYDNEQSLNPFDLGGNPSWLYIDESDSWLRIVPSFTDRSGEYKRRYDPSAEDNYKIDFVGVKTLGEDGTFLGETSYLYTYRRSVPRSLKYNPYSGEAFSFNDTTTGNFRYNGPQVRFVYGFELLPGLITGASVNYRILNGLKNIYTRAETIFRELQGNIGASYRFTDNFSAGVNYIYDNGQESIVSKSEDLLDVEVFNYFGDTYATRNRTNPEQKIANKGNSISAQLYYRPSMQTEFSLVGIREDIKQKILIHYSTTADVNTSYHEFEAGYSNFNSSSIKLFSRYEVLQGMFIGVSAGYSEVDGWSKNSIKEKLLWDWKTSNLMAGAGFAWQLTPELLAAFEYEHSILQADSAKYIDNKFLELQSANNLVRAGFEYNLLKSLKIRAGYNYNSMEKDMIIGGDDITINTVTAGLGFDLSSNISMDVYLDYTSYSGLPGNLRRNGYSAFTTLKLNSF